MRPEPISPENREEVIVHLAAGCWGLIDISGRIGRAVSARATAQCSKVGRNDQCPGGSGKRFKRCCGGATVN
jgi:hypothetical protein